jgi:ribosomal subunit interface protein
MELELRMQELNLNEVLRDYIERRLRFALSRFQSRVGKVTFRISDENGPRGGNDKTCRISAEILPSGTVVLESTQANLFTAIDAATDRLRRAVAREVEQRRDARLSRDSIRREISAPRFRVLSGGKG